MRRLDELLTAAATRGDRRGPEDLIQHLERRMQGEREQVVAAPSTRTGRDETRVAGHRRTRWAFALASFAVAVAANVRDGDLAAIRAGGPSPDDADVPFLEWMIGLDPEPQFTDCEVTSQSPNGSDVRCSVEYSPDSFFVKTLGVQPLTFAARITPDGALIVQGWPPPPGLSAIGTEMRTWIATTYPELEDRMFGTQGYAGFLFTREAGELLNQYVDEFLASQDD